MRTGKLFSAIISACLLLNACTVTKEAEENTSSASLTQMQEVNNALESKADRLSATYEIFVYSFADSNNDGIGDLRGIENKMDYIQDMGFNTIWMTPVCPSPTYHKYDVRDYKNIDSQFGTLDDFDALIRDCHERGISVITDLVLNHTSVEHPWFKEAAEYVKSLKEGEEPDASVCPYVNYYRFIREGQEGYAPLGDTGWYYEARFWEGMPDLNLEDENVRKEIHDIMTFWIEHGVDGFRLDAVTSYFTGNDEKNIAFLTWLAEEGRSLKEDLYFVAEAWTDRKIYAQYYQSGINSFFDFSFANSEGVIASTVKGIYKAPDYARSQVSAHELYSSYSAYYRNAPFYTNHDMSRSAGYYAIDDGSRTKIAGAMNLFMSGNVFVYYGEELGMKGSRLDENKRAPMYWSEEETEEMCKGPENMESFAMKYPSYAVQKDDPYSIWNYYKEALHVRNAYPAIINGYVTVNEDLSTDTLAVYTKTAFDSDESVLIVMNISENAEETDLSKTDYTKIGAVLTVSEERITLEDNLLHVPAFGIAVLEKES